MKEKVGKQYEDSDQVLTIVSDRIMINALGDQIFEPRRVWSVSAENHKTAGTHAMGQVLAPRIFLDSI